MVSHERALHGARENDVREGELCSPQEALTGWVCCVRVVCPRVLCFYTLCSLSVCLNFAGC